MCYRPHKMKLLSMIIELIPRSHLSKKKKCDPGNLSHLKNRCRIADGEIHYEIE